MQGGKDQDVSGAPERALEWHRAGRGAVLATVVETWGSAPRRVGAQLVVSGAGEMEGSVSGGCVEGAVVLEAMEALAQGQQKLLCYGVSDGDAFAVGLACGGTIRILLEPVGTALPEALLAELVAARAARVPIAYDVDVQSGARNLSPDGHAARFARDQSGFEPDGSRFIAIHNPPLRVMIVGAVHIAQALVPMAQIAGFDPLVIDPRDAFATDQRFPGAQICRDWPGDALSAAKPDARTALVLLTHDPKLDDPALHVALASDVFYIGALGSRRTHAARQYRLAEVGFSPNEIARINGPIGLNIGAANPAEIAVAILGQMLQTLRRGDDL
jgi:xanthine dehydrogenase accessory factor